MVDIKKVFLTAIGSRDPYAISGDQNNRSEGAVLTAYRKIEPEVVVLLPILRKDEQGGPMLQKAIETREIMNGIEAIKTDVEIVSLYPISPVDYESLTDEFLRILKTVYQKYSDERCDFYTSITSGTAQMATLWFILKEKDILKGDLIQVSAPQFSANDNRVKTVNLSFLNQINAERNTGK